MKSLSIVATFLCLATPAFANDAKQALQSYLDHQLIAWAQNPDVVAAIRAQNKTTAGYDDAMINTLDKQWRASADTGKAPVIESVLHNQVADFLREQVNNSSGIITEAFVMDAVGLNVAASAITSDYWQGDEAKFLETFAIGPKATHFSDVEEDASTKTFQAQVSFTVSDPDTGVPIGAITVGVNAMELM